MRSKLTVAAIVALSLCGRVQAVDTTWTGLGDGLRWDVAGNWSAGLSSTGNNRAAINGTGTTVLIDSVTAAATGRLFLADNATTDDVTLNMTGGTLDINHSTSSQRRFDIGSVGHGTFNLSGGTVTVNGRVQFALGSFATAQGTLNVTGGTLNVSDLILMGVSASATLTQELNLSSGAITASRMYVADNSNTSANILVTGGTLTLGDLAVVTNFGVNNTTGHFQLDGGLVTVNNASPGGTASTPQGFRIANGTVGPNTVNGSMDITAGILKLNGDATSVIQDYINRGILTGFGSPANVVYDYNNTNVGFTTVTAMLGGTTDTTWTGSGDGINWTSAGNWDHGTPTGLVAGHINGSPTVQVGTGVNAAAFKLALAEGASTDNATLNVNNGTLNLGSTNDALIGAMGHGTLNLTNSATVNSGPLLLGVNNGEASARGTVSVANSTLAVNGAIRLGVGDSTGQTQQLTVSGTSTVTAGSLTIGEQAASVAEASVSGGAMTISGATNLSNGQGTLQITGGSVTTTSLVIGEQAGSVAQVNVSGGSLAVTGGSNTNLGGAGNGTLEITGGATVTLGGNLFMGATNGATNTKGTLTINGGALNLTGSSKTILMGNSSSSVEVQTLNMVSGSLMAGRLFVDDNTPSFGGPAAVVNMTGGTMTLGDLAIPTNWGLNGLNGHFDLHGGIVIVNNASTGSFDPAPSGFRIANGPDPVNMLNTVSGSMDITSGALLLSGDRTALVQQYITDGVLTGSAGALLYDYDVTNIGYTTVHTAAFSGSISTTWTGGGDGLNWQNVGNWNNGVPIAQSIAAINGSSTAQVATGVNGVASTLLLAHNAGTDNTTLNVNGGTLSTGIDVSAGTKGHATLNITNSGTVTIGGSLLLGVEDSQANARGTASVNGGTLAVAGAIRMGVGNATTQTQQLTVAGTSTVTAGSLTIAETAGTVAQMAVSGGTTTVSGTSIIGDLGQGSLQVSGGNVLLQGLTHIGVNGVGALSITGGTVHATSLFRVGGNSSATVGANVNAAATVTIDGGSLAADSRLLVGAAKEAAATQTINLISGSLTADWLLVADENNSNAVVNMSGGTMTVGAVTNIGGAGAGTMLVTGGVATLTGNIFMGVDATATTGKGTLTIDGGTLNVSGSIVMGASAMTTQVQTINMTSGTLTANRLFLDDNTPSTGGPMAVVNMTGGTMTVGDLAIPTNYGLNGLNGHFQLGGGTVTVNNTSTGGKQNQPSGFRLANGEGQDENVGKFVSGTMDITEGTLKLTGDALSVINPYITVDHSLKAYNGTGRVIRDFDVTNPGFTTVTAQILGDANRDAIVDIFDINYISSNWAQGPEGDVNGDGTVDIFDINAVSSNWQQTNPDGPGAGLGASTAVPEPATLVTLLIGALLSVAWLRVRGPVR